MNRCFWKNSSEIEDLNPRFRFSTRLDDSTSLFEQTRNGESAAISRIDGFQSVSRKLSSRRVFAKLDEMDLLMIPVVSSLTENAFEIVLTPNTDYIWRVKVIDVLNHEYVTLIVCFSTGSH